VDQTTHRGAVPRDACELVAALRGQRFDVLEASRHRCEMASYRRSGRKEKPTSRKLRRPSVVTKPERWRRYIVALQGVGATINALQTEVDVGPIIEQGVAWISHRD